MKDHFPCDRIHFWDISQRVETVPTPGAQVAAPGWSGLPQPPRPSRTLDTRSETSCYTRREEMLMDTPLLYQSVII